MNTCNTAERGGKLKNVFFAISFQKNPLLVSGKTPWTALYPQINPLHLHVLWDHIIKIWFLSLLLSGCPKPEFSMFLCWTRTLLSLVQQNADNSVLDPTKHSNTCLNLPAHVLCCTAASTQQFSGPLARGNSFEIFSENSTNQNSFKPINAEENISVIFFTSFISWAGRKCSGKIIKDLMQKQHFYSLLAWQT